MLKKYQGYLEVIFGLVLVFNGVLLAIGVENNLVKVWDMSLKFDLVNFNLFVVFGVVVENVKINIIVLVMENEFLILFNIKNRS